MLFFRRVDFNVPFDGKTITNNQVSFILFTPSSHPPNPIKKNHILNLINQILN